MQKYLWDLLWELGLAFCSTWPSTQVSSPTSIIFCYVDINVILKRIGTHVRWYLQTSELSMAEIAWVDLKWLLTCVYWRLEPLHTWDWEPMTIIFQALSLVENAEPVQVHFSLRLRDQRSMWMQYWCKVYMGSYMASNISRHLNYFPKLPLGGRPNTKPLGDHGTSNAHNR